MAIEDAVALARTLISEPDPARALDAFALERYPRTAAITKESWRLGQVGQWSGRISCWLRNCALGLLLPRFGHKSFPKYAAFDIGPLRKA